MMINVQKITSAKRVLMIINGSLMIINVQKTTSAKRDVNISLLEKCYWIFHFSLFVFPFQRRQPFLPFYFFTFKSFSLPTAPAFFTFLPFYLFTFKSFFPSNGVSLFYLFTFLPFYL